MTTTGRDNRIVSNSMSVVVCVLLPILAVGTLFDVLVLGRPLWLDIVVAADACLILALVLFAAHVVLREDT